MAHQTEIVVNGVVTEVTEFDHTAQEIDDSVDRAMLSLLAVAAAAAYDPEGSYAVGDYCTHGGKLYKCNTAIPDGEEWNAAHWTVTSVAAELAEVRTSLSNKVGNQALEIPNSDCNDIANFGLYRVQKDTANAYNSAAGNLVVNAPWDINTIFQLFLSAPTGQMLWRTKVYGLENPWSKWVPLANATPPQEYDLPMAAGVTSVGAGYKNTYSKDQFGIVRVWFSVHFETIPTVNQSVFQLPVGFRPSAMCCGSAYLSMGAYYPASINIDVYGNGFVGYGSITHSGAINMHGFIEFPTIS